VIKRVNNMYERIIIGAGIYGLYAAIALAKRGRAALVLDCDVAPFLRASYINQARVHNGYHYPRSYATAAKSAKYFKRFIEDYSDCILFDFDQIYAVAAHYSWTNGAQFAKFCGNVSIRCDEMTNTSQYFNATAIDKAFHTREFTFDAKRIGDKMYKEALDSGVHFMFGARVDAIKAKDGLYHIALRSGETLAAPWILNATYAGINEIHQLAGFAPLNIKYELCEIILCRVSENIDKVGLTVMDGPFFSLMPFGKSGYHSLTAVSKTPHITSYDALPTFPCQDETPACSPDRMQNCNDCARRPRTAFVEMSQIAGKYLNPDIEIAYVESLFTLKPILKASEIDDSRPTLIRQYSDRPEFYSIFSGKINTIYDLDGILV
jgi:glycine/D-amino acid oxidase-like deaminating enzyme